MRIRIQHERTGLCLIRRRIEYRYICPAFQIKRHGTFPNRIVSGMSYSRIPVGTPIVPCHRSRWVGVGQFTCGKTILAVIEYPYFFLIYTTGQISPKVIIYETCIETINGKCSRRAINNTATGFNTEFHFIFSLERHLQSHFRSLRTSLGMFPAHLIISRHQTL